LCGKLHLFQFEGAMSHIIVLSLMMLRWWALLLIAVAVGLGALFTHLNIQERKALWDAAPPKAVALAQFDPKRDIHAAGEVTVIGWAGRAGIDLPVTHVPRRVHFLFGGPAEEGLGIVRAAVVLTPQEEARFAEAYPTWSPTGLWGGGVLEINALASQSHRFDDELFALMREHGLHLSDGFVFLRPFLFGRREALELSEGYIFASALLWMAAGGLAILAAVRLGLELAGVSSRTLAWGAGGAPWPGFVRQIYRGFFGLILIALFYLGAFGLISGAGGAADLVITLFFLLVVGVGFWWEFGYVRSLFGGLGAGGGRDWPKDDTAAPNDAPTAPRPRKPRLFAGRKRSQG
jgi:hypothetical protein